MWYAIEGHDTEGALPRRMAARPAHLARLTALRDEGRLLLAGPCPAIDFESLAAAQAWAQADPYVEAGVYARVDVRPFRKVLP